MKHRWLHEVLGEPREPPQSLARAAGPARLASLAGAVGPRRETRPLPRVAPRPGPREGERRP